MSGSAEDRGLVAAFLAEGTDESFLPLYRRHSPRLYRVALRMCPGREGEAAEVVQEVWARALVGLKSFAWQSSLAVWLHAIALNHVRERNRARQWEEPLDNALVLEGDEKDEGVSFADVSDAALERGIAALPERCREVLILHDIEGHTHAEIGLMLSIQPGTSKSQLAHARRKLRNQLRPGRMEAL